MSEGKQRWDEDGLTIGVRLTWAQFREINRRAGLGPYAGKARSEYMVGCVFGEPLDELLERVHEIRDAERARFRADLDAERQKRELDPSADSQISTAPTPNA
jgi:hypothetical protein